MRAINKTSLLTGTALSLALLSTGGAAVAQSTLALEEIVVTAQRRESTLLQAPIAVSAFDANEIERRQSFNVVDIVNNVPNLIGNNNIGQGTATTVFLRGVGTTESIVTVDPGMGFYIDDVYMARQGVNNFSLFDVERVEVLRGPQGTLYGRNTNAGAIKIISQKPHAEKEFAGEVSYGRFNRLNTKASVNGAFNDRTFVRLTGIAQWGDGYTANDVLGRDVNDRETYGTRAQIRILPNEDLTVDLAFDWSESKAAGLYGKDILGFTRPFNGDLYSSDSSVDTTNVGSAWGVAANISYDISETTNFQSITSWRNTFQSWNLDLTDQPVSIFNLFTINDSDQLSQEFKFSGTAFDDRLEYSTGVFYFEEDSFSFIGDQINLFFGPGARLPLPFFSRDYDVGIKSYAAFAEGTYSLTDDLRLIVGGRITRDEKTLDIIHKVGGTVGLVSDGPIVDWDSATLLALGTPTEQNFSEFTPRLGLQYDITEDVNVFAMFTRGFKSGGWAARTNNPAEVTAFEPEIVDNYEVGLKSSLLDGQVRLAFDAFYYDYTNLFNSATGASGNFIVATNDAEVYGLEGEITARITENLDIFGNFGIQEGKYIGVDPELAGSVVGGELQRLPGFSAQLGFSYVQPVNDDWNARVNADYNYSDSHFTNLQNTPAAQSGTIDLVSAALNFEREDQSLSFGVSCRNCLDDEYISQSLDFSGLGFLTVYPGEPMTWLFTIKTRL
ncbi:MAG: TonB-dependent receptor [Rhodospirillaceae bacterium]|jgi:iron complex outermembrane recepter protein|nr:TonB-dependent receptor [Rhodospirillaceae bacterium]MBT5240188.1 TonB-dependent receptor [Rhodospirillaceae bacterium]MBT5566967.1 TonB-dependent receptor [Rhodospirillaceae bacterium]MBT6090346.1 TonB-dependent receptor [Rhodospirillaceae bacterium]MBT7450515.1 TonB-dependent receptor [Rhodospirillaceae bacterium]